MPAFPRMNSPMAVSRKIAGVIAVLSVLLRGASWVEASLPPIVCDENDRCTLVNAYRVWPDREPCEVGQVFYPSTEDELVGIVADAVSNGTKLKAVSKWAHSIPKLACPAGNSGTLISTQNLNSTIIIDTDNLLVTVDCGVMLEDLLVALAAEGLAIPYTPYWSGISICGLIGTGAHGSSLWQKGGAVHEYVTSVRTVLPATAEEGYATVRTFTSANPRELAALKVHLGLLGILSQVTLEVEPLFKRRVTFDLTSDIGLEFRVREVPEQEEFGDVVWFPSQRLVRYRHDNRVPVDTPGDAGVRIAIFDAYPVAAVQAYRAADLLIEATRNAPGQCDRAEAGLQVAVNAGFGLDNNQSDATFNFTGYPVVGFNQNLQADGSCSLVPDPATVDPQNPTDLAPDQLVCLHDLGPEGWFFFDDAVAIPLSRVRGFINDVRRLVALRPFGTCDIELYIGFLFRYVKGPSSAYLGKTEDSVDIDMYFKRADDAETPILNTDVHMEMEQLMAFKYRGLPHWGKNRPVTFTGVPSKYPRLGEFLEVKNELDPDGFFSNEWTDAMLGLGGELWDVKPYCALEGLCICSEDVHCAPEAGYVCRPGLVYRQARVCRFEA